MEFFSRLWHWLANPCLLDAAERADVDAVRKLLAAGASPNVRDGCQYTPLMRAVSHVSDSVDRGAVVDLLVGAGADVNAVEQAGQTALMHAAHADHLEAVHRLLAAGARVRVRASSDRDALHIAFVHDDLAIARALAQAELHRDGAPRRILCSVLLGDGTLVRKGLADGNRADVADACGLTALHAAALTGDPEMVGLLVAGGAELDAQDCDGVTALIQAARSGRLEIVVELLEHGASTSVRQCTTYGDDALSAAARKGQDAVVGCLLAKGAVIGSGDINGSALTAAASGGHESTVALLLEHGAGVRGVGALCAACASSSTEVVRRLLAAGADPNERIEIGHYVSMTPLVNAVCAAAPPTVSVLVEAGADVNARDSRGDTLLMLLAECGSKKPAEQVEIAKILIAAGAEVDALGEHGRTALYIARQNGNTPVADVLRVAGADPTLLPRW